MATNNTTVAAVSSNTIKAKTMNTSTNNNTTPSVPSNKKVSVMNVPFSSADIAAVLSDSTRKVNPNGAGSESATGINLQQLVLDERTGQERSADSLLVFRQNVVSYRKEWNQLLNCSMKQLTDLAAKQGIEIVGNSLMEKVRHVYAHMAPTKAFGIMMQEPWTGLATLLSIVGLADRVYVTKSGHEEATMLLAMSRKGITVTPLFSVSSEADALGQSVLVQQDTDITVEERKYFTQIWVDANFKVAVENLIGLAKKKDWPQYLKAGKSVRQFVAPNLLKTGYAPFFDTESVLVMSPELAANHDGELLCRFSFLKAMMPLEHKARLRMGDKVIFRGWIPSKGIHFKGGLRACPDHEFPEGVNIIVYDVKKDIQPDASIAGMIFAINSGIQRAKASATDLQTMLNNFPVNDPMFTKIWRKHVDQGILSFDDLRLNYEEYLTSNFNDEDEDDATKRDINNTDRQFLTARRLAAMDMHLAAVPRLYGSALSRSLSGEFDRNRFRNTMTLKQKKGKSISCISTYIEVLPYDVYEWAAEQKCEDKEAAAFIKGLFQFLRDLNGSKNQLDCASGHILCNEKTYKKYMTGHNTNKAFLTRHPNTMSGGTPMKLIAVSKKLMDLPDNTFWVSPTDFELVFVSNDGADGDDHFNIWFGSMAVLAWKHHKALNKANLDTYYVDGEIRKSFLPIAELNAAKSYLIRGPVDCLDQKGRRFAPWCSKNHGLAVDEKFFTRPLIPIWKGLKGQKEMSETTIPESQYDAMRNASSIQSAFKNMVGIGANAQMFAAGALQGLVTSDNETWNTDLKWASTVMVSVMLSDVIDAETQGKRVEVGLDVLRLILSAANWLAYRAIELKVQEITMSRALSGRVPGALQSLVGSVIFVSETETFQPYADLMQYEQHIVDTVQNDIRHHFDLEILQSIGRRALEDVMRWPEAQREVAKVWLTSARLLQQDIATIRQQMEKNEIETEIGQVMIENEIENFMISTLSWNLPNETSTNVAVIRQNAQEAFVTALMAQRWQSLNSKTNAYNDLKVVFKNNNIVVEGNTDLVMWLGDVFSRDIINEPKVIVNGMWRSTLKVMEELVLTGGMETIRTDITFWQIKQENIAAAIRQWKATPWSTELYLGAQDNLTAKVQYPRMKAAALEVERNRAKGSAETNIVISAKASDYNAQKEQIAASVIVSYAVAAISKAAKSAWAGLKFLSDKERARLATSVEDAQVLAAMTETDLETQEQEDLNALLMTEEVAGEDSMELEVFSSTAEEMMIEMFDIEV